jgi:transposase InsO family protein
MKCILSSTGKQLLDEVHSGQCGIHGASKTLVRKVFRSGFYWPTAKSDAAELVQRCEACQYLSKQQHLPAQQLQTIPVTWPFACWGLDMIGPFKKAQGGYTHVLVAIDKFTKWIEFKPIASLTSTKAVEFIQDIIFRFGIPNSIITDLGSNFTSLEFFDFCEQKSIQIKYASVAHPRANGQVEQANGMILEALRKKVFDKNEKFTGKWIRELPYVVWSLRTQPSRALHGNTPFFMVYGSEAVLPADLKFGAPRLVFESIAEAEATRLEDIDVLEEERLNVVIHSARYQQTLRRYHNKAVRGTILCSGRSRPPPNSNGGGTTQVVTLMGRTIHSSRSHSAGIISSHSDGRHRNWELLEYRTPQEVLSLAVFQKLSGRQCTL